MSSIQAIAMVTMRAAVRSRLVLSLITLLLLSLLALGLTVKGDGTLQGQVKVLLYYTTAITTTILGIATLWMACGAISEDIREKHIQLVAVKPVPRWHLWAGKWLGLVGLDALLMLGVAGPASALVIAWAIHRSPAGIEERRLLNEEVLLGRRVFHPRPEQIDDDVRTRAERLVQDGLVSPRISRRQLYANVERRVLAERSIVSPGASRQWIVSIPAREVSRTDSPPVSLQFHVYTATRDRKPVRGEWSVGWSGNPAAFRLSLDSAPEGTLHFPIPASAFSPGQDVVVTYANPPGEAVNAMLFDPYEGVVLLVPESGFVPNLLRTFFVLLCHLGLLAALGLTAGTIFSFPVAAFMSASVIVVAGASRFLVATYVVPIDARGEVADVSLYQVVVEHIVEHLEMALGPALQLNPVPLLADGRLVSWGVAAQAAAILLVAYPALLFVIGALALRRRELALPGQ